MGVTKILRILLGKARLLYVDTSIAIYFLTRERINVTKLAICDKVTITRYTYYVHIIDENHNTSIKSLLWKTMHFFLLILHRCTFGRRGFETSRFRETSGFRKSSGGRKNPRKQWKCWCSSRLYAHRLERMVTV